MATQFSNRATSGSSWALVDTAASLVVLPLVYRLYKVGERF